MSEALHFKCVVVDTALHRFLSDVDLGTVCVYIIAVIAVVKIVIGIHEVIAFMIVGVAGIAVIPDAVEFYEIPVVRRPCYRVSLDQHIVDAGYIEKSPADRIIREAVALHRGESVECTDRPVRLIRRSDIVDICMAPVEYPECSYYALMRFVSDSRYNWANLLKIIAKVACSIIVKLNNKDHIYTLCIDDTIIERARGKHIEGLSRTFDHVKGKCVKGFANLLICWSDGTNILPVVSALMSSRKEKHIIRDFDKKIDKRKAGAKRRADSKKRKPSMVYRYCKAIINFGIKAQYALMDTWFYSDKLTSDLQEIGLHSICMIKKNLKFSFVDETTRYNL